MNNYMESIYLKAVSVDNKHDAKMFVKHLVERRMLLDNSISEDEALDFELGHLAYFAAKQSDKQIAKNVKHFYGCEHPFNPEASRRFNLHE
jgi:hypothetical protein